MDSGDSGDSGTVGTVGTPVLKSFRNRGAVTAPPFVVACLKLLQEVLPGAPSGQCCPVVAPSLPQMEVSYSQVACEFCYQLGGDTSN